MNSYEELENSEGEKKIYRLAKNRNKSTKDMSHIKQMKDANGIVLTGRENKGKVERIF